jgi:hypothetical protein
MFLWLENEYRLHVSVVATTIKDINLPVDLLAAE